jgi:hypothetical protein
MSRTHCRICRCYDRHSMGAIAGIQLTWDEFRRSYNLNEVYLRVPNPDLEWPFLDLFQKHRLWP